MVRAPRFATPLASSPGAGPSPDLEAALDPARLPPPESPQRWEFLQRLRAGRPRLSGWLDAIEQGSVALLPDLLAALSHHLDPPASLRLLRWCLEDPQADPALPERFLRVRDADHAALLRQAVSLADALSSPSRQAEQRQAALLPLLGHQRCPQDFPLLQAMALEPRPTPVRRAALEGLLLGLSAWPQEPLRDVLRQLARDHQPTLGAAAIDGLARLPGSRPELARLGAEPLAPALTARVQRRLRASAASRLVLVVHGRSGGVIPPELQLLALELQERRGAPVDLWALTDPAALARIEPHPPSMPCTLVPLLLLPGHHVRSDVPAIAAALRRRQPLRCLPFLGAWPLWQQALATATAALAAESGGTRPVLLHHPVEGNLPRRYLQHLEHGCQADCLPPPPVASLPGESSVVLARPLLPLVLAANRLTESLEPRIGSAASAPLLQRPWLRRQLLSLLEALP